LLLFLLELQSRVVACSARSKSSLRNDDSGNQNKKKEKKLKVAGNVVFLDLYTFSTAEIVTFQLESVLISATLSLSLSLPVSRSLNLKISAISVGGLLGGVGGGGIVIFV
jgi:hypothetical protein